VGTADANRRLSCGAATFSVGVGSSSGDLGQHIRAKPVRSQDLSIACHDGGATSCGACAGRHRLLCSVPAFGAVTISVAHRLAHRFETIIVALLAAVCAGFVYRFFCVGTGGGLANGFVAHLAGPDSLFLATGVVR
jgi:hypothetical protein